MSTGLVVLAAPSCSLSGSGGSLALRDGRFRGTHAVRGAGEADRDARRSRCWPARRTTASWASGRRCCSSPRRSARPAGPPGGSSTTSPRIVPGVTHVEVDAEHHLDLVRRLGILRTPTTLVLDAAGPRGRAGGGGADEGQVYDALAVRTSLNRRDACRPSRSAHLAVSWGDQPLSSRVICSMSASTISCGQPVGVGLGLPAEHLAGLGRRRRSARRPRSAARTARRR